MTEAVKSRRIRIGTRKSRLAMVQTRLVAEAVRLVAPDVETEIVPFVTTGDKILDKSLVDFGGKGVFVSEFEEAIADGTIDIAVHSAKDMPAELLPGLSILAVLEREDPRDVLITVKGRTVSKSPMTVGTSSLRRQVQIRERKDAVCSLLRGNVNTRLEKLEKGMYDGIILAAAGLKRLGLQEDLRFTFEYLPEQEFIPSGGQGIIAVEGREDSPYRELFQKIDHELSHISLTAEREVLRLLSAGCNEAVGVYSWHDENKFHMKLMKETINGVKRCQVSGKPEDAAALAGELVRKLRELEES